MYHDVMVLGAGPGGCMAARVLSDAGFKVLLVEAEKIPRDKPCGGFIPPQAAGLIEDAFGPIPASCLSRPDRVRGARLICEGGGDYELPFSRDGISVVRSRLDAFLASGCGAQVMDGCRMDDFNMERFHIQAQLIRDGKEETAESTYLVAADGADSTVLRLLRPEFHRLYAAPHLERTMLVLSGVESDWDPEWMGLALMREGRGIARFFVKDDIVGLAINHDPVKGWKEELDALSVFLRHRAGLRMQGEAMRQPSSSNRMGTAGHYNLGAGCALLVGEAAGLLDPWGFGIHLALESGRVAAESLVESAGERITPHIRYRYRMQEILERELKQRRELGGRVGDLDTSSLAKDKNRTVRRDRRMLRRRLSK